MRRSLSFFVGTVFLALLGGSQAGVAAQDDEGPSERILFVGNSFTFNAGGVDNHFEGLVAADEDRAQVEVEDRTIGGATLTRHLAGTPELIRDGDYSIVVLQGDIPENASHTVDPFLEAARALDATVRESGGRTVLYMAWSYERLSWIGLDEIAAAHGRIGEELDARVAPVGLAMASALAERPDMAMLDDDLEHQTVHAAYLAAATIYATIFDRSPEGLPYLAPGITAPDAAFLQHIAWETVEAWQAGIPVPGPEATS